MSARGAVPAGIVALEAPAPLHGDIMVEYWDPWLGSGVRSKHPSKLTVFVIILVIEKIVRNGRSGRLLLKLVPLFFAVFLFLTALVL